MRPLRLVAALVVLSVAHLICTRALQARSSSGALVPAAPAPRAVERQGHESVPADRRGSAEPRVEDSGAAEVTETSLEEGRVEELRAPWQERLAEELTAMAAREDGEVGVYVQDLTSGLTFGWRAEEPWYLASGIKVPVAIAVLRQTEEGRLALTDELRLEAEDRVDGTGSTNGHPLGAPLRVDYLLEQMLVYSDNTASDMLIRRVGLEEVNRLARELSGRDLRITTLADVRRRVYGELHPEGRKLGFPQWVTLRGIPEVRRGPTVAEFLRVPVTELSGASLEQAYARYYATGVNSGPLDAYGRLLAELAEGRALGAEGTAYLLEVMSRIRTGQRRLSAGLPQGLRFAHKTGTQYRRLCDLGLAWRSVTWDARARAAAVVAACTRGFVTSAAAESALREVGHAVRRSGVLDPPSDDLRRDGDEELRHIASGHPGRDPAGDLGVQPVGLHDEGAASPGP